MTDLLVTVGDRQLEAMWTEDAPETRTALEEALPVSGTGTRWGDELYISAALDASPENARETVPEGALAYWPAGQKLCLFWGPTPASSGDEPRGAAPVTVVARVANTDPLADLDGGAPMGVERADDP